MPKSSSKRILETPSAYARRHYYYVQENGTLQSLEPHISSRQGLHSFLFFVVLSGSGRTRIGSQSRSIGAGDCVWIDCSGEYAHESSAEDPWSLFWIHYDGPEAAASYASFLSQGYSPVFHPRSLTAFTEPLEALFRLHRSKGSMMELLSNKYITDIVTACFAENAALSGPGASSQEKLREVHEYLETHYMEHIDLGMLSERFFLSRYHLSREFSRRYGTPITGELNAIRISHAKSMLRFSTAQVAEIAQATGFQDAGYFIKVFRAQEGMTPLEYRKRW